MLLYWVSRTFLRKIMASFAVISSALVATVINDQPVLSLLVSIVLTTALLGFFYRSLSQSWDDESALVAPEG